MIDIIKEEIIKMSNEFIVNLLYITLTILTFFANAAKVILCAYNIPLGIAYVRNMITTAISQKRNSTKILLSILCGIVIYALLNVNFLLWYLLFIEYFKNIPDTLAISIGLAVTVIISYVLVEIFNRKKFKIRYEQAKNKNIKNKIRINPDLSFHDIRKSLKIYLEGSHFSSVNIWHNNYNKTNNIDIHVNNENDDEVTFLLNSDLITHFTSFVISECENKEKISFEQIFSSLNMLCDADRNKECYTENFIKHTLNVFLDLNRESLINDYLSSINIVEDKIDINLTIK